MISFIYEKKLRSRSPRPNHGEEIRIQVRKKGFTLSLQQGIAMKPEERVRQASPVISVLIGMQQQGLAGP
jgi:hypothetical protein